MGIVIFIIVLILFIWGVSQSSSKSKSKNKTYGPMGPSPTTHSKEEIVSYINYCGANELTKWLAWLKSNDLKLDFDTHNHAGERIHRLTGNSYSLLFPHPEDEPAEVQLAFFRKYDAKVIGTIYEKFKEEEYKIPFEVEQYLKTKADVVSIARILEDEETIEKINAMSPAKAASWFVRQKEKEEWLNKRVYKAVQEKIKSVDNAAFIAKIEGMTAEEARLWYDEAKQDGYFFTETVYQAIQEKLATVIE